MLPVGASPRSTRWGTVGGLAMKNKYSDVRVRSLHNGTGQFGIFTSEGFQVTPLTGSRQDAVALLSDLRRTDARRAQMLRRGACPRCLRFPPETRETCWCGEILVSESRFLGVD
jgi:hypothetical protein